MTAVLVRALELLHERGWGTGLYGHGLDAIVAIRQAAAEAGVPAGPSLLLLAEAAGVEVWGDVASRLVEWQDSGGVGWPQVKSAFTAAAGEQVAA